jgi:hypothetical protein
LLNKDKLKLELKTRKRPYSRKTSGAICQVALLLGHRKKEMQPDTEVPWVLAADNNAVNGE